MKRVLHSIVLTTLAAMMIVALSPARANATPKDSWDDDEGQVKLGYSGGKTGGGSHLSDNPWSVGLLIGFATIAVPNFGAGTAFAMEIPVEYTFKVGPGELAPHFGFMVSAGGGGGGAQISLPFGARYKIKVLKDYPLYVWPLLDIGPSFAVGTGISGPSATAGFMRVGAGISYLIHPNVELMFQPLNIGAVFAANGGYFLYNFLLGSNFRF